MQNINMQRIDHLRQIMEQSRINALLVLIGENRRYLSGFTGEDGAFDESAGALLITGDALLLLTDSRYTLQAEQECPDCRVVTYKKGLSKELPDILAELNIRHLGYEKRKVSVEQFGMIEEAIQQAGLSTALVGTVDMVEQLRIIKDESEIDAIKDALAVAENAFLNALKNIEPGMPETDAAWEIEKRMRQTGAQSVSFPVITAGGPNAALPHATPGPDPIEKGQSILFDWGARLNGYCSDTSRTLFWGKPGGQFEKIFNAVYGAQQKAIDAVRPGAYTGDIDAVARNALKDQGLDTYFGHGLGHGIGLAIHEKPSVSPVPERNTRIEENMVFTIEPGVYIPGWGGVRLENVVAVRPDGAEVLNRLNTTPNPQSITCNR